MDNQRLFLFVALSFVMLLLWQAWVEDYGPVTPPPQASAPQAGSDTPGDVVAPASGDDIPATPADVHSSALPETDLLKTTGYVDVQTDLFSVRL